MSEHSEGELVVHREEHHLTVPQVKGRLDAIVELMKATMLPDIDFGRIPGTGGSKPTLLKPGAEKLALMFMLDYQYDTKETYHDDGHLTVRTYCTAYHAPSGNRLGGATGVCTSRESKYAFRRAERTCPSCGKPAIIKGKAEYGGGFLCWAKKGGCNAKFGDNDPAITNQPEGQAPNPNLADTYNTVMRMAEKRAYLAATRLVTGCSAIFDEEYTEADDHPTPRGAPPVKDEPAPEESLDQEKRAFYDMSIIACEDMDSLKNLWDTIPVEYKKTLEPIKNQAKAALEKRSRDSKEVEGL